jgi:hypothetical protein
VPQQVGLVASSSVGRPVFSVAREHQVASSGRREDLEPNLANWRSDGLHDWCRGVSPLLLGPRPSSRGLDVEAHIRSNEHEAAGTTDDQAYGEAAMAY